MELPNVFGTTGKFSAQHFSNISSKDREDLSSMSSKMPSEIPFIRPKIEVELKDTQIASTITFKFVAFKTMA